MNNKNSKWIRVLLYLIGSCLFLFGSVRFLDRGDIIGGTIYSITAGVALFTAYISINRERTTPS